MQTEKTTKELGILVTFPKSRNSENFEFHINSDDLPNANNFSKFLKAVLYDQGLHYIKTIRYSKVKLISWHVYKIPAHSPVSFEQNKKFGEKIVELYLKSLGQC